MKSNFIPVMKKRRSIYLIGKDVPLSDEEIRELLENALKYTPTAHNTQLTRVVLLLRQNHDLFWDFVIDAIREATGGADISASEQKIDGFRAGYATALFYNDTNETKKMIEEMPLYKDQFSIWAQHACAMLQYSTWCLLEEAGCGASLQHYNPIVDERVRRQWDIDPAWELVAQMPFGNRLEEGWDKPFMPMEKRFFVYE